MEYKGAFTENFVAQALQSPGNTGLYYWTSKGTAEVDFIVEQHGSIFPLEVKAGTSQHKKSLLSYAEKYQPPLLLRTFLMNLKRDGNVANFPLYLISQFRKFSYL